MSSGGARAAGGRGPPAPSSCRALLAEVLTRPIPHRFGSWRATIHVHVLGEGRCTLDISSGRGAVRPGHVGHPTSSWVITTSQLWDLYARGPFVHGLLAALQRRQCFTTEIEDLIMLAKCFDHDASPPPPRPPGPARSAWRDVARAGAALARGAIARRHDLAVAGADRCRDLVSYWCDHVGPEVWDLRPYRWLVSTPAGLLAASEHRVVRVLPGSFNGIAIRPDRVLAFQANDHFLRGTRRGRIVELELRGARIVRAGVACKSLDNACHQIVPIGDHLIVCETAQDRLLEFDARFVAVASHHPAGRDHPRLASPHLNSVLAIAERRYVMCHHSTEWTGRPSEVLECDADFVVRDRRVLRGGACHCLIEMDGGIACCLSEQGEVDRDGVTIARIDSGLFARGLAWDGDTLAVGGSELPHRSSPRRSGGALFLFDGRGRRRRRVPLPGAPRDVRALPWAALRTGSLH